MILGPSVSARIDLRSTLEPGMLTLHRHWLARVLWDGRERGSLVPIMLSVFLTDFAKSYRHESYIVFVSLKTYQLLGPSVSAREPSLSTLEPAPKT